MKTIIFIFVSVLFFHSCSKEDKKIENTASFKVYYFHPTARCESCINIENFTKELIETKYIMQHEIKFISLNIEEPQNRHFKDDYNLMFSSVVLTRQNKDKYEKFENLDSIWNYSHDKDGFFRYMNSRIKQFIQ